MNFKFHCSVCSDLEKIKVFVTKILDKLKNIIEDEDLIFDLKLILNELIINAVIHGNGHNINKSVDLYLEITKEAIRIEVKDQGSGIDFDVGSYDPDELKVCGRGLVIVNGLSDEMYIQNNSIVAVKHIV